jgi:DNA-binding response OmpR family regulator
MTRVLLVDDEVDLTWLLGLELERAGFEVCCADSIETALAVHGATPCEVLVTDLHLPDGDGVELARRITIPVRLALTGSSDPADAARLSAVGFSAVLVKPIAADVLVASIRRAAGP